MGRVLVLGNAGLDISLRVPRLPDRGETLLGDGVCHAPGGKGLNQAVSAARAGAEVLFRAPIGGDAQGREIEAKLANEGSLTFDPHPVSASTDFSLLMVLPDGENSIVSAGPCAAALGVEAATAFAGRAGRGDLVVLQGNLTAEGTAAALAIASQRFAITLLNPAPLWWDVRPLLPFCGILVANRGEAEAITGAAVPTEAAALLCDLGASIAIVTLGAEGCLVHSDGALRHYRASPVEAVDTTGCGDTFCGVLAARLAGGHELADAISTAQRAAALTATRTGAYAALPSAAELCVIIASDGVN